jgi:hypothetical protein
MFSVVGDALGGVCTIRSTRNSVGGDPGHGQTRMSPHMQYQSRLQAPEELSSLEVSVTVVVSAVSFSTSRSEADRKLNGAHWGSVSSDVVCPSVDEMWVCLYCPVGPR